MKSFQDILKNYSPEIFASNNYAPSKTVMDEIESIRFLCSKPAKSLGMNELRDSDCLSILDVASQIFLCPTKPSEQIALDSALGRDELVRLFRLIKHTGIIQKILTFESPMRRRISFLRQELLPENISTLYTMFNGEVCLPNHVEFHPALMCNLRCRACPNCHVDSNDDWIFLDYPKLGEPLNASRIQMIADLALKIGVRNFSFGGGGEPSMSDLTLVGISHLRKHGADATISLYTNGIFPNSWHEKDYHTLVTNLNKVRFSIDASNAKEWSSYKGRPEEYFERLWDNIKAVVQAKKNSSSSTRIGASCLVSDLTCGDVQSFLKRARDAELDFCDIKAVETCFSEKEVYSARGEKTKKSISELTHKIFAGTYEPMDVVVDDTLLQQQDHQTAPDPAPSRCWIATRGRMLTVGPYGELYPCSDAANPGAKERHNNKLVGQLTAFSKPDLLYEEFMELWEDSLPRRTKMSRDNCNYCVPSHNNFNAAVDKIYRDWTFGIMPEDQPFQAELDHYLSSRLARA